MEQDQAVEWNAVRERMRAAAAQEDEDARTRATIIVYLAAALVIVGVLGAVSWRWGWLNILANLFG